MGIEKSENLFFCGLYNYSENQFPLHVVSDECSISTYKGEASNLAEIHSKKPNNWKAEKKNNLGTWTVMKITPNYSVVICAGGKYRGYVVSKYLEEIKDSLKDIIEWENKDSKVLKKEFNSKFNSLFDKYKVLEKADIL